MLKRRESGKLEWVWEITEDDLLSAPSSQRADAMLTWILKDNPETAFLSRNQIQNLIRDGQIKKTDSTLKSSDNLFAGDVLEISVPAPQLLEVTPQKLSVPILFEDEYLAIIDKPKGMSVHPSVQETKGTLVNALLHQIKNLSGIGGVLRPGIVHRLDKHTSGVMVISKKDESHQLLSSLFAKHDLKRQYWALCFGAPRNGQGKIETLIGRSPKDRKKMSSNVTKGRKAITHFVVKERFCLSGKTPFASLVELTLETGRTHQVRVHMTTLGCSIFGDSLYGIPSDGQGKWKAVPTQIKQRIECLKGQTLHARHLSFEHPITKKGLSFTTDPPQDFQEILTALRAYTC